MSDLDGELGFDHPERDPSPDPEPPTGPRSQRALAIAAIAVLLLGLLAAWFFLRRGDVDHAVVPRHDVPFAAHRNLAMQYAYAAQDEHAFFGCPTR